MAEAVVNDDHYDALSVQPVIEQQHSDATAGLTDAEAARRLAEHLAPCEKCGLCIDAIHGVVRDRDLDAMNQQQLRDVALTSSIYARVSPEYKLRPVEAFQSRGEAVVMTGDGVNDAPALKKASIGIAMETSGTDVSKKAADMMLQDDIFTTIVAAVEQGRIIFDNVRKFIRYSLSANVGELCGMLIGPLLGMPMPPLAMCSDRDSLFRVGLSSNNSMLAAVTLTFGLQLAFIYIPFLNRLFRTVTLSWADLMIAIALSTIVLWAVEIKKRVTRSISTTQADLRPTQQVSREVV